MPANDCEDKKVTFYSPQDTFGGEKPLPACNPATLRNAPELTAPEEVGSVEIITEYTLGPIVVGNREVSVSCRDLYADEDVSDTTLTTLRNSYTETVDLEVIVSPSDSIIAYIARNKLNETISAELTWGTLTAERIASLTGMELSQAETLFNNLITIQDNLTEQVRIVLESTIECFWVNKEVTRFCPSPDNNDVIDPDIAYPKDVAEANPIVIVAEGTFKSTISQDDADNQAITYAESKLVCLYTNDLIVAKCTDPVPGFGYTEEVPVDSVPVYPGLEKRIGEYVVLPGAVVTTISKSAANEVARNTAYSNLSCFYVNDPVNKECEDPNARSLGVNPAEHGPVEADVHEVTTGQYVSVPRGMFVSNINTADATQRAESFALSLLECCFVNKEIKLQCEDYTAVDEHGNPVIDPVTGKPLVVPASQIASPVYSIEVPAGAFTSCNSQEEADEMARASIMTSLVCYYCNTIVLPSCVPDWVVQAASSGIRLEDESGNPYVYTLTLPLDLTKPLWNPFKKEYEDMSQWSTMATVGAPSESVCAPEYPQAQQIAENNGLIEIKELKEAECAYTNDTYIAACASGDPLRPDADAEIGPTAGEYSELVTDRFQVTDTQINGSKVSAFAIPKSIISQDSIDSISLAPTTLTELGSISENVDLAIYDSMSDKLLGVFSRTKVTSDTGTITWSGAVSVKVGSGLAVVPIKAGTQPLQTRADQLTTDNIEPLPLPGYEVTGLDTFNSNVYVRDGGAYKYWIVMFAVTNEGRQTDYITNEYPAGILFVADRYSATNYGEAYSPYKVTRRNPNDKKPYTFYTKFRLVDVSFARRYSVGPTVYEEDYSLSDSLSTPGIGEYVEIPAGTISVTKSDVPEGSDPKAYANKLAEIMAQSMLYCVFSNHTLTGTCPENRYEYPVAWASNSSEKALEDVVWRTGKGLKNVLGLWEGSNSAASPVVLPKGTITSDVSLTETLRQAEDMVLSLIYCSFCNSEQTGTCEDPNDSQLSRAVVPECTVQAASKEEADEIALSIAESMVACVDLSKFITEIPDIGTGTPGTPGAAGPQGPPGPQGPAGTGCTGGQCNGVYS